MKYLICCSVVFLSFGQHAKLQHRNNEKIVGIEEIEIDNDDGKIVIRSSGSDATTVESTDANITIAQEGKKLIIKPIRKSWLWGLITFDRKIDFHVNVAPSVRNVKVSCAGKSLDVRDCNFEKLSLHAASAKVRLQNVVGDFHCDAASVKGVLEDVRGNLDIHVCSSNLYYIMHDYFAPVHFNFHGTSFKFSAFVSDAYKSISANDKTKITKSHLPLFIDNPQCDFIIRSKGLPGKIAFAPLSELKEDVDQLMHSLKKTTNKKRRNK